ncbi:MAG: hypothetical protein [Caudoviricetes sp.]|nr:MAG: hypothetical protein [Caudoviricetes sp.]
MLFNNPVAILMTLEGSTMLLFILIGYTFILCVVHADIKRAYTKYKVSQRNDVWTVRDARGRFVTISSNWWDLARVGA